MANQGNTITLAFAGDSGQLEKTFGKVEDAATRLGSQVGTTEAAFDSAARGSSRLAGAMDKASGFSGALAEGADGVSVALQSTADAMSYSDRRAEALARAQSDVAQAALDAEQAVADMAQSILDASQAELDGEQAAIDLKQALLDQATAQKEYNDAVKEFGAGSAQARQAKIDLAQADLDAKQAAEDAKQAQEDLRQANIDGKQAAIDGADAVTNLSSAQRELESQGSALTTIMEGAGMLTGILAGLAGIIGTVTAVQWAWNIAMTANPIGLIIAGIALLIGAIVLIATKTTWFQDIWKVTWTNVKKWAVATWDWLKRLPSMIGSAFAKVGNLISAPFRAAFNAISRAWNNTVGRLSWSVPNWVPGVGGNSIAAPRLPTFHTGGVASGAMGSEFLAVLKAGERITPTGSEAASVLEIRSGGAKLDDLLVEVLSRAVRVRGGNVQLVLSGGRRA